MINTFDSLVLEAQVRPDSTHVLAAFIFEQVHDESSLFSRIQQQEVAYRALGHMTNASQLLLFHIIKEGDKRVNERQILTRTRGGLYLYTRTDQFPNGGVIRCRFGALNTKETSRDELLSSQYIPRTRAMLESVGPRLVAT